MRSTLRSLALVSAGLALVGCPSRSAPPPPPAPAPAPAPPAPAPAPPPPPVVDAAQARPPAEPAAVLTLRVINAGSAPMTLMTNPDLNEVMHTRRLWDRPPPDARQAGELLKFFVINQMPLCSQDGGAGYGGLGQTGERVLAPGEAWEFRWDGRQRVEVNQPGRGVCAEEREPGPGRYRFEFDQPYNAPQCVRPVVVFPLAADAPRTIDIRCTPRPRVEQPAE